MWRPRVRCLGQNWRGGPKLQQKVNLGGLKRVFFLEDQNHNFEKLKRPKI